jgi:protein STE50
MLKHIKDIRSPIAVAQQKQAARKAETSATQTPPLTGTSAATHGTSQSDTRPVPPKLLVDSRLNGVAPGLNTAGVNGNAWPPEVMSPAVETKERADDFAQAGESSKSHLSTTSLVMASSATVNDHENSVSNVREIPPSTGLSYAVAIYPYMAEQEDEFDVVV